MLASGAPFEPDIEVPENFMSFPPPFRQHEARIWCKATCARAGNHGSAESGM